MTQVRNAMGLGETGAKQVLYMIYYVVVRICAKQLLGSDVLRGNVDVTPKELQRVCEAARLLAKGLARYKNNWATEELLRQYLPRRSDVRSLTSIGRDEENREDNDKVDPPVPESTLIRSPNWLRKSSSDTRWLKIKHVLGLDGADRDGAKQALYDKYVAAVRMAANGAGFTYDTTFSRVQRSQLDFAVRIARAVQPGLAQYENNWLTVELLRAHYDHQRHFLRLAESVHAANPIPPRSPTTIPRPACPARGELSGSKLRAAMGLGDPDPDGSKRALYHNYMDTIRYSAGEAHYNFNMPVRMTPRALLGQIFEVARKIQPGLAQYEDDWASEAMLQHYVARKRARQRNSRLCRAGGTGDLDGSSLE
ncbi:hypothetical protein PsYK624_152850 [Phanerochaete sordida]|uniref:Uncharacterized protein n=1 Tax=Phanerochaete sordida TaxID=48140 RepID=A0A9P3GT06_9APHY|nr:hypothetical protein PsYK624_152850 [Phanerochaete sordida]